MYKRRVKRQVTRLEKMEARKEIVIVIFLILVLFLTMVCISQNARINELEKWSSSCWDVVQEGNANVQYYKEIAEHCSTRKVNPIITRE